MRKFSLILTLCLACASLAAQSKGIYDFTMKSIDAGLEALYTKYKDKGLVIVGIPANNFMSQEPGTDAEIKTFCTNKYNVTFPMMSKVSVKGDDKTPLYVFLTGKDTDPQFGGDIKWNFTKFLFDRSGKPVARFEPNVTPDSPEVTAAIEAALGK